MGTTVVGFRAARRVTKGGMSLKTQSISRVFHARSAAEDFCALARRGFVDKPDEVTEFVVVEVTSWEPD